MNKIVQWIILILVIGILAYAYLSWNNDSVPVDGMTPEEIQAGEEQEQAEVLDNIENKSDSTELDDIEEDLNIDNLEDDLNLDGLDEEIDELEI